jgi:hypothetical protein
LVLGSVDSVLLLRSIKNTKAVLARHVVFAPLHVLRQIHSTLITVVRAHGKRHCQNILASRYPGITDILLFRMNVTITRLLSRLFINVRHPDQSAFLLDSQQTKFRLQPSHKTISPKNPPSSQAFPELQLTVCEFYEAALPFYFRNTAVRPGR